MVNAALAVSAAALLPSCAMDTPFGEGAEGTLSIRTDIRGDVVRTRAIGSDELAVLRENCVVYIENNKGLIRKFKGLDNIPAEIKLRTGSYVAEAWSGDSVSASFSQKFYRGWQRFEMNEGSNALTLKCNIANVIVSVDPASLDVNLDNMKVTFSHSRGELVFDKDNIGTAKGYFMMPNADKDLSYKVEGKKADGTAYLKQGTIANVQRAHEYCMTVLEDNNEVTEGGALIKLIIADIPVIDETVEIFPAPSITGDGFDIADQVVSLERSFSDTRVLVRGYFGLASLTVDFSGNFTGLESGQNILEGSVITTLKGKGINVEKRTSVDAAASADGQDVEVEEVFVTFSKSFLDALPASDTEYMVTFNAVDGRHKSSVKSLRIANDATAVEHMAPVSTGAAPDPDKDPMAVLATKATLTSYVNSEDAASVGVKYRRQGESAWLTALASSAVEASARRNMRSTRAASPVPYTVSITGLTPGTVYEYAAFCDGYDAADVRTFTTESVFSIPNSSFENWSTYSASTLLGTKNVILPWSVGDKEASFWGSGNEGGATANKVLTDKSSDMVHSGSYSARLETKSAVGVIAAGNIFVGTYVKTDGTDGVLSLGREYNGTHPSKLRVWVNYRPAGNVKVKGGNESYVDDLQAGGTDQGQIYVALTDGPVDIRTKASDRKLFNPDDQQVLAYNQVTFKEAFGPDGELKMLEIPIVYNDRAKAKRPTHVVIVASASKFGDFYSGAEGSVFYFDDFELVYE